LVLGLLVACSPASDSSTVPTLEGVYRVKGVDLTGQTYQGTLTIERTGEIYRLTWQLETGVITGVGVLRAGVLAASWDEATGTGVVAYTVSPNGTLEGIWTCSGSEQTGTERATRQD
jgi:hypothetical protein